MASLAFLVTANVGCGKPANSTPTGRPAGAEVGSGALSEPARDSFSYSIVPSKPTGWPAGEDPAAAVQKLAEHIKQLFSEFKVVNKQIYPAGWSQLHYKPESIVTKIVATDSAGKPQKALVRLKYQKLSSIIHPTEEAAAADTDLLPYPGEETREAMMGRRFAKPWPPIDAEITYELKDGRWARIDYKTAAVGREGADWLDRIGVP